MLDNEEEFKKRVIEVSNQVLQDLAEYGVLVLAGQGGTYLMLADGCCSG